MKLVYAMVGVVAVVACAPVETPTSVAGNAATLSTRIQAADTPTLCATYRSPDTTPLSRQMIEAELAVRGVNQCNGANIGAQTAAQSGSSLYARSGTGTGVAGQDYDCADFANSASAQRFFLASGGPSSDPHDLDRDGDGLACEWGTQIRRIASYRAPAPRAVSAPVASAPRSTGGRTCFTGPRGGTYTITASGNRNYGGC